VLGRYPGLKSFLQDGHVRKYAKLESVRGSVPPALRFFDKEGLEVESVEILGTHTPDEIAGLLRRRGINSDEDVLNPAPDTSCGGGAKAK